MVKLTSARNHFSVWDAWWIKGIDAVLKKSAILSALFFKSHIQATIYGAVV